MNVELLLKVKAAILAEPDAFRMDTWSCGTAHCIAGWAMQMSGVKIANVDEPAHYQMTTDNRDPLHVAAALLDLLTDTDTTDDGDGWSATSEAERLFVTSDWPDQFEDAYERSANRAEKARIAADRIDHFIATDGAE